MTTTDIPALIAEARGFAAGSESARATLMRDLADALEHKITWEDADTIARADYRLQLSAAVNRYASAEAERDEALAAIADIRREVEDHTQSDNDALVAIEHRLSRIPEHPKED